MNEFFHLISLPPSFFTFQANVSTNQNIALTWKWSFSFSFASKSTSLKRKRTTFLSITLRGSVDSTISNVPIIIKYNSSFSNVFVTDLKKLKRCVLLRVVPCRRKRRRGSIKSNPLKNKTLFIVSFQSFSFEMNDNEFDFSLKSEL